ncbi:hypothetical protein Mal64_24960 [Pseudobythopirellula maris]|uniref:AAA+ ATPase domain-containing protein n=1 Tax=Pseudobythopirellula maris TaxID=2527991 RepID=A0A5C5ZPG3_9BACT|nr:AAA family ATPase [Pseudobythopirellula maris]TWT89005.1 hypothetical protein Mal64_24960 [Pseudobythopirellula maris]
MQPTSEGLALSAAGAPPAGLADWKPPGLSPQPTAPPRALEPPPEPQTLEQAGLTAALVEGLVLKVLLHSGASSGRDVADRTRLSRALVSETLGRLRDDLQVTIKGQAGPSDYIYQLSEAGFAAARRCVEQANYADAAPVPLEAYERAMRGQSLGSSRVGLEQLRTALAELTLRPELLSLLAQAINDGRGMFLFGSPGNGKTSIAERVCRAFGESIWIPRAVSVGGDMIRLFDASCHEEIDDPSLAAARYDRRWVLIRRPTVVVGGELTLDQLDPAFNADSGVSEAPVQLKACGGALVIDDFGRQRASSTEILNRLIVPLEKRFDFLSLASGRQLQVPFETLFVLSTNLEPRELVDEAFLRRIPYKIEVDDPSEQQFRSLLNAEAARAGYRLAPEAADLLLSEHYRGADRPMRFCHPRDLVRQAVNFCEVHGRPPVVDEEALGAAVRNYFAGL